jgi:hypothetical protein
MAHPLTTPAHPDEGFVEVVCLIQAGRARALQAVNTERIDLYWPGRRDHQPQDRCPDKALLQAKLHEFYLENRAGFDES